MKILIEEGIVVQIMNLLKQHPYNEVEGILMEIQNSKALREIETVNPIGYNSPQYNEPNDEEFEPYIPTKEEVLMDEPNDEENDEIDE